MDFQYKVNGHLEVYQRPHARKSAMSGSNHYTYRVHSAGTGNYSEQGARLAWRARAPLAQHLSRAGDESGARLNTEVRWVTLHYSPSTRLRGRCRRGMLALA